MPCLPMVAIVDDDEDVREALGDLLMVSGFACEKFAGAAGFLEARKARRFDCLITDIRMPETTGIDLIERLHAANAQLPIIVLSSVLDEKIRAHALELGVRAWFTKPASDGRMLGAIATAVNQSRDKRSES